MRSRSAKARTSKTGTGIPLSLAASLVAVGIVYGDMGTSPVYSVKAIVSGQGGLANMTDDAVVGFLSLVIWAMTLIATIKYVVVATHADNHGEGGIFALYNVVKRHWKGLSVIAMIGGATFLADSILTPAVSITSAVEGLKTTPLLDGMGDHGQTFLIMLAVGIVAVLFLAQHSGTSLIGRFFGPAMVVWFAFLAAMGVLNLAGCPEVLRALNPVEGIRFLLSGNNLAGFAILGSIFLAITGAEALYSDIGHVGRGNIYATWPFVKVALLLNYFGQGAWIITNRSDESLWGVSDLNPFFEMMPDFIRPVGVLISIMAGIIASQALITGAFTLVSEAEGLFWLPRLPVSYPGEAKGQVYIPVVNAILWACTTLVILFFQSSSRMEAAYGLALTITMLSTTVLLFFYVWKVWGKLPLAIPMCLFFGALEGMFFVSSLAKFLDGGYVTVILAAVVWALMMIYSTGSRFEHVHRTRMKVGEAIPLFEALSKDTSVPFVADNLVYLTADNDMGAIDCEVAFSALKGLGKRANAYWIVTVVQTDFPYTCEYALDSFGTGHFFRVRIRLGYKMHQYLLQSYMRQIMAAQCQAGTIPLHEKRLKKYERLLEQAQVSPRPALTRGLSRSTDAGIGSVRYVLMSREISPESNLPERYRSVVRMHKFIQKLANSPVRWFGLELTDPIIEKVVLYHGQQEDPAIKRVALRGQKLPCGEDAPRK